MSTLGVTVLPKDNALGNAVAQAFAEFNRRKSEQEQLSQQESQYTRSLAEQRRLNDAAINEHGAATKEREANTKRTEYQTLDDRAKAFADGVIQKADGVAKTGDHAKAAAYTTSTLDQLDALVEKAKGTPMEADAVRFRQLAGERLLSRFVDTPDTDADVTARNATRWTADATGRAAAGGQGAIDVNAAMKVGTGEQLNAPAFGNQQQREMGPKALERSVAIAGGREASAGDSLQASTQREIAKGNQATQLQIAREGDATQRALANAKNGPAVSTTEQDQMRAETASLVRDLISHPGREGATGQQGISSLFGILPAPKGGTDEAGFVAKLNTVKSRLTLDNLKLLKGAMSDKDIVFLNSVPAALERGLGDDEFKSELQRVLDKLEGRTPATGGYMNGGAQLVTDPNEALNLFRPRQ